MSNKQRPKYQITNTTRKKEPKNRQEEVGFMISVFVSNMGVRGEKTLQPGQHAITEELEEHHLTYQKGGLVNIVPIKDMGVLLKSFTEPAKKKTTKRKKKQTGSEEQKTEAAEKPKKRMATAMSMDEGTKKAKEDMLKPDEGAVNPDGKDNFTAVAPHIATNKDVDEKTFSVTASKKGAS